MSDKIECDSCRRIMDPVGDRRLRVEREGPQNMGDLPVMDFCSRRCLIAYFRAEEEATYG